VGLQTDGHAADDSIRCHINDSHRVEHAIEDVEFLPGTAGCARDRGKADEEEKEAVKSLPVISSGD